MKRALLLTLLLFITLISASAQTGRGFGDDFNGNQLDAAKWDVFKGSPTVSGGRLTLDGGATRAEIQSKQSFLYGALTIAIDSAHWKPQSGDTDSSFGVEIFTGANGLCHYSAVLKANGHLGLLRPKPDASNNCPGDPPEEGQEHVPLRRCRSFVPIVNAQPVHSELPQRQLVDQKLRFVIFGELPLLRAKAGAMRQPAAIDGHAPVLFMQ